jgi:hypothetical protein
MTAAGSPAKGPPPKKGTTVVTTTVATTTTLPATTVEAPAPPPPAGPTAAPLADISLTTLSPDAGPLYASSTVTFTSVVTNRGPDTATGVYLAADLDGASVVGAVTASGSCSTAGALACTLGELPDGASAVVTVTLAPAAGSRTVVDAARSGADQADPATPNNVSRSELAVLPGHAGAPVLAAAPLGARASGGARLLTTSIHVDEPATIFVGLVDAAGKAVPMLPRTLVDYLPALRPHMVIPHAVDRARWVPLSLRFAGPAGRGYRLVVRAVAPNGATATTTVRFAG